MIFTEGRFFVLLLVCLLGYWPLRSGTARKVWLLICSSIFYGAWDVRFLLLLYATALLDYFVGGVLGRVEAQRTRKALLTLSIVANLGVLGCFKYLGFFASSAVELAKSLGITLDPVTLDIVLPVGVSFYTFQSMSYTIDVYRRQLVPSRSALDFVLFVTFFPQLVAGPIVRAVDFLPQLETPRRWAQVALRPALLLFLSGFIKKACIADHIAPTVDALFANPEHYGAAAGWIAMCLYLVQIYCDFSGYSDMAIACAEILGYKLTLNFDFPYLTWSITDYWRRWHISLSTWFRDYVYIPLGGNRRSPPRTYFNLTLVFFLCGLWHGAGWTYVVWGLLHGIFLVINRLWSTNVPRTSWPARMVGASGWVLTQVCVLLAFVIFRAPNFGTAQRVFGVLFGHGPADALSLSWRWVPFLAVLLGIHLLARRRVIGPLERRLPDPLFALAYGIAWAITLPWVAAGTTPFIYFQF